jgi:hypothetical protein
MRCQPNDLAIVIGAPSDVSPPSLAQALREHTLGATVRVLHVARHGVRGPIWQIEREIGVPFGIGVVTVWGIADCDLQPIRGTHAPTSVQQPEDLTADHLQEGRSA